jgi:hypothetical protein
MHKYPSGAGKILHKKTWNLQEITRSIGLPVIFLLYEKLYQKDSSNSHTAFNYLTNHLLSLCI